MKGQDIRDQFGVNQWMERKRVITSLDLAKRAEILPGLRQVHWDLVIVDEAHRMSAADESHKSLRYRLGRAAPRQLRSHPAADRDAAQGRSANFSLFLQLLDADAYADVKSIRRGDGPPPRTVLSAPHQGGDGLLPGTAGDGTGWPSRSSPSASRTRSISRSTAPSSSSIAT